MKRVIGHLLAGKKDLLLVSALIGILIVLFTPIPKVLLDLLLITNVSFALMILLLTFYTDKPLSFSTFPSLLLIATLFRLALNIAATRLILEHADAGRVIAAVGSYVVGGNYVIGLVVFLILVVVQYVVVTNGAQRVAEVAARFTLDSMPGKQMSIDAEMNMGVIDEREARRRRAHIEREASFYGAMDGATKFVKGDAIAGIIIILIDIVGGLTVGVVQHSMSWGQALHTYTLLTVGDGIVTQIPSLIIATATGIIITRAATDDQLGEEVSRQVLAHPRTLLVVAIALLGVMWLPGIPLLPIAVVFAVVAALAYWAMNSSDDAAAATSPAAAPAARQDDLHGQMRLDPLGVRLGGGLTAMREQDTLAERLQGLRRQLARQLGVVVPEVRLVDDPNTDDDRYLIAIWDSRVAQGTLVPGHLLAINPGGKRAELTGVATEEPTFGLAATWIDPEQRQFAKGAGYTLVDAETVLVTHLGEVLRRHAADLLSRADTDRLLARVRERQPSLVEELVPAVMTLADVQKVLQHLLREQVSVRNIDAILEVLVDQGRTVKAPEELAERVRERLAPAIFESLVDPNGEVHVLTLAPELERSFLNALRQREGGMRLLGDAHELERLLQALAGHSERMMAQSLLPALLCPAAVRRPLRQLVQRAMPHLNVLGVNEVPTSARVRAFGVVNLPAAA